MRNIFIKALHDNKEYVLQSFLMILSALHANLHCDSAGDMFRRADWNSSTKLGVSLSASLGGEIVL